MRSHSARLVTLGILLITFGSPVSADEPVFRPASPAALEKANIQVRSLFRSASIAFAVTVDQPVMFAAAADSGVTLGFQTGGFSGRIIRLNSIGGMQWQHEVSRGFSPYPPEFTPGANGAAMCAYVVLDEEGPIRFLVFAPDGAVAYDDTVAWSEFGPWGSKWIAPAGPRWLSPGGDYYYDAGQVGNEILLRRLTPGNRRIRIPPLEDPEASKGEELTIGFVGNDRLFVSGVSAGKRRAGLVDLRSHVSLWTELEFSVTARPVCIGRFQAGVGRGGELICFGDQAYGFDVDGHLLWGHKMSGDWIWGSPGSVVCSLDSDLAALFNANGIGIVETRTGRLLGAHGIDLNLSWTFEGSFADHRLTLVGQGGLTTNEPILIQATVGPDGKIISLEEHKIMMRGLAPSALSCIVMPGEGDDGWIVAGFRK